MGQPSVDYHIIPIDMESIWDNLCGLPYNSHRNGRYMGQPSVDYHIIPIELVICKSMPLIWITYGPSNPQISHRINSNVFVSIGFPYLNI